LYFSDCSSFSFVASISRNPKKGHKKGTVEGKTQTRLKRRGGAVFIKDLISFVCFLNTGGKKWMVIKELSGGFCKFN
jgi:hypothetical protein